jgi:hypothetical protein
MEFRLLVRLEDNIFEMMDARINLHSEDGRERIFIVWEAPVTQQVRYVHCNPCMQIISLPTGVQFTVGSPELAIAMLHGFSFRVPKINSQVTHVHKTSNITSFLLFWLHLRIRSSLFVPFLLLFFGSRPKSMQQVLLQFSSDKCSIIILLWQSELRK